MKTAPPRAAGAQRPAVESEAELILLNRIERHKLPTPQTQVALIPGRKFRYDVVWPEYGVAVEVQGGVWTGGAHVRGKHYESDAEKSALAQIAGYIVLYITPGMIDSFLAMDLIIRALVAHGWIRFPQELAKPQAAGHRCSIASCGKPGLGDFCNGPAPASEAGG